MNIIFMVLFLIIANDFTFVKTNILSSKYSLLPDTRTDSTSFFEQKLDSNDLDCVKFCHLTHECLAFMHIGNSHDCYLFDHLPRVFKAGDDSYLVGLLIEANSDLAVAIGGIQRLTISPVENMEQSLQATASTTKSGESLCSNDCPHEDPSCITSDEYSILISGGATWQWNFMDEIYKYNPETKQFVLMDGRLYSDMGSHLAGYHDCLYFMDGGLEIAIKQYSVTKTMNLQVEQKGVTISRYNSCGGFYKNKFYSCFGAEQDQTARSDCDIYSFVFNGGTFEIQHENLQTQVSARDSTVCAFYDGHLLILGGYPLPNNNNLKMNLFDGSVTSLSPTQHLPAQMYKMMGTWFQNSFVLCGGQENANSWEFQKKCVKYNPANEIWIPIADMGETRVGGALVTWGHKLLVFGGQKNDWEYMNSIEIYESSAGWKWFDQMPHAMRFFQATVTNGGNDIPSNLTAPIASDPPVLSNISSPFCDDYEDDVTCASDDPSCVTTDEYSLIISGGATWQYNPVDTIYKYNPATKQFTIMNQKLINPMSSHLAGFQNCLFFIAGGLSDGRQQFADDRQFSLIASSNSPTITETRFNSCGGFYNNRFYSCFGNSENGQERSDCDIYSFAWVNGQIQIIHQNLATQVSARHSIVCAFYDDHLLIFGGFPLPNNDNLKMNLFDGSVTSLSLTQNLPTQMYQMMGTWFQKTFVLCGGQENANSWEFQKCVKYNPADENWIPIADMGETRAGGVLVAWGNKMLVFGGQNNNWEYMNSIEVYDSNSGWSSFDQMPNAMRLFQATVTGSD